MAKQWGVYPEDNGDITVRPIGDKREHDWLSTDCPCMPTTEVYGEKMVIIHNAFDFRHVTEWLAEGGDHE